MKRYLAVLLFLISFSAIAHADVATLKNGDRITGALVMIQGGSLTLKSDTLGSVSIPLANVTSYSADKPVAVIIKGQAPIQGSLTLTSSGDFQVVANGRTRTIPAKSVDTVMPASDYNSLVAANPAPWQAWKGNASLGYNLQNGNQHTTNLATTLGAVRERPAAPIFEAHWRTEFDFAGLLSHAHQDGNTVTSRTFTANLMQQYVVTPDNFLFLVAQLNHVSTQGLYLQQTYGGGYGRNLIKNARTNFSVTAGPTFVQEKFFTGQLTRTAELLIGESLGEQFSKRFRLDHFLQFYPDLINTGEYRFDTSTVLSYKLSTRFSLNASAIDLYLSNPPAGNQKNNITFSTGIGYSF